MMRYPFFELAPGLLLLGATVGHQQVRPNRPVNTDARASVVPYVGPERARAGYWER